ncbi:MAG: ribose 5-phosphate isomerase B [Clostridia bacterium]|nr:ribose 5-phosphate isomerase B [Clostridia bacterium]
MKIAIGCDHGGFDLKEEVKAYLVEEGHTVEDFGCYNTDSVDYPDIAAPCARSVAEGKNEFGVLICSTGIGISMAANKVNGVRAALCTDEYLAMMTRKHNNANVLCMGGHVVTKQEAFRMVDMFLKTEFEGGRHCRRVDKLADIENGKI